jgi:hypothetical protein
MDQEEYTTLMQVFQGIPDPGFRSESKVPGTSERGCYDLHTQDLGQAVRGPGLHELADGLLAPIAQRVSLLCAADQASR